jgi:hypothetical protein
MRWILAIAAMVLLVSACGGDDKEKKPLTTTTTSDDGSSGGDAEAYIDAVSAGWNKEVPWDAAQVRCVAAGIVDVVGVDALTEAGITPDELVAAGDLASLEVDLPDDATDRLGDAVADCDVVATLKAMMVDAFADELGAEMTPDALACLTDHLDDQAVADGLAAELIDAFSEQFRSLVVSATVACPEVVSLVFSAQTSTELTPDAEACIRAFVDDNADLVREAFASSAENAARREFTLRLARACPEMALPH